VQATVLQTGFSAGQAATPIPADAGEFCLLAERQRLLKGLYAWIGVCTEELKRRPLYLTRQTAGRSRIDTPP